MAVNDLSIDIADKEFLVFVGPSGCGKTTSLRLLAGLEEISDGNIYIGDRLVNDVAPKDRDIAMVFQSYALYPHMSVYDNMAFGLKLRKTPRAEIDRRVKEAAGILGIQELLDRKPKQLSGGQRQRVALGRAIVREPAVFLMDEPLSNLDAKLRVATRAELSKLHQRLETTFIYVTHDQMEAMTMGSRIVVMNKGEIQQVDEPNHVYTHPVNKFVAGFLGSPSINFIDTTLTRAGDQVMATAPGVEFILTERQTQQLLAHDRRRLTLGFRPEHIRPAVEAQPGRAFNAKVRLVEPLGSEQLVHLQIEDLKMVARLDPLAKYRIGDIATFSVTMEQANAFDPETEASIF
ncbi:MAG: sn-glycerol-3-phosphate ABC transporter ATP-binding protein UgpC [Desulfobacterota bacterium]|nr:sn-glycerol-3-phosphate ABC transporter ATP-binding protein UgpC [Thermodesulfobacteriota bacterium]